MGKMNTRDKTSCEGMKEKMFKVKFSPDYHIDSNTVWHGLFNIFGMGGAEEIIVTEIEKIERRDHGIKRVFF